MGVPLWGEPPGAGAEDVVTVVPYPRTPAADDMGARVTTGGLSVLPSRPATGGRGDGQARTAVIADRWSGEPPG
ncbi:hypothetical protein GCM10010521_72070 [Streptomyces rameus]|uniref:Uncharacterized protein n=1 Tax=Streptomyces rameus TaxID=68261 RepID=A0ABN3V855_9ACTN